MPQGDNIQDVFLIITTQIEETFLYHKNVKY